MPRKGRLRRKLRSLEEHGREQRRDLGMAVLRMHRDGEIDERSLSEAVTAAASTADEIAAIQAELGISVDDRDILEGVEAEMETAPTPAPEAEEEEPAPPEPEAEESEDESPTDQYETLPSPAAEASAVLTEIDAQIEDAERRVQAAADNARLEAESAATAEILALEKDLERERAGASQQLAELTQKLGQAEARIAGLEKARADSEAALGEMTIRSNEANVRAQQAEAALETAGGRGGAGDVDDQVAHLREELRLEREAKAKAIEAAEQRLTEIDAHAAAVAARIEAAEGELAAEAERLRAEAAERGAAATAARDETETAARAAAAAWLRGQIKAVQREADREAAARHEQAQLTAERRVEEAVARAEAAEKRAAEMEQRTMRLERRLAEGGPAAAPAPALAASGDLVDINSASLSQLRELGMSVTQANRVIAYRERLGGYSTVDQLDAVPGFPPGMIDELKKKVGV